MVQEETPIQETEPQKLTIILPNKEELFVSVIEKTIVHEIRQIVYDSPKAQFYTCFYLEYKGTRLNEELELGQIEGFDYTLNAVPDLYNEHEARVHIGRLREILTYFKSTAVTYGLDMASTYCSTVSGKQLSGLDKEKYENNLDFENVQLSMEKYVPEGYYGNEIQCLKQISLSRWNPPPFNRKMQGDLLYLTIELFEKTIDVTCAQSGFYVNGSTCTAFDCKPISKVFDTLPSLLCDVSKKFATSFKELQEFVVARHPYEYLLTPSPSYPWIVKSQEHKPDLGRVLDANFSASDVLDTLCARDWNEDLQNARELPRESAQERVQRDQNVFRSHSDFIEAALKGAMAVVNKAIMPITQLESDLSQMYLHNNIFLSEGYDNKDQFDHYGGLDAAHVAMSKDIDGIKSVAHRDMEGIHTLGTALIDYKGRRILAQTIVPGILKKNETQESPVKYGSVDSGKEIQVSEHVLPEAEKLAKALHLAPHTLVDGEGKEHTLCTSLETKWVQGTDSRLYIMDLYRLFPVDATFLETVQKEPENPYPHQMALLRPELVELFYEHKIRLAVKEHQEKAIKQKEGTKEELEKIAQESLSTFQFNMALNPDAFTKANLGNDKEQIEKDEKLVKEASGFISVMISQLILELVQYGVSIPVDTVSLTTMLHRKGINMRYLGKITGLFEQIQDKSVGYFTALLKEEMIARACKRILRKTIADLPICAVGGAISHFFNCLFASEGANIVCDPKVANSSLTRESLHEDIKSLVAQRFRFKLADEAFQFRKNALLRSICLKVGIQLEAKDYAKTLFVPEDILNIYPIVKHAPPRAAFAQEAHEHGRMNIAQDQKDFGMELLKESLSMYEQVFGPIHPETSRAYDYLALQSFNRNESEQAIYLQRRALIASERTTGIDSRVTLEQYMNLAYFEFANDNHKLGLAYMHHALKLWLFLCDGFDHPETASVLSNIGAMLQKTGNSKLSIDYCEKAAELTKQLYTLNSSNAAAAYESLAEAYILNEDYRKALDAQKVVYSYYKSTGDKQVAQKAGDRMKTITAKAVEQAKKELALKNKK
ncbi:Intracellular distribution of mitochondria [Boothiomyces macroporosus]|uniref:Intracellular distribution of mitochondria n=1 Tax=Boothiomyces macroporosus TaxID=261099 RepID=A0AAD5UJA0_9FUNG|nr:Intracellular distribution of mitochondria [Boothiomyces macroporosus]